MSHLCFLFPDVRKMWGIHVDNYQAKYTRVACLKGKGCATERMTPSCLTLVTGVLPIKVKRERGNLYRNSLFTIIYYLQMFGSGHNPGDLFDVLSPSYPLPTITKSYPFYT